MPPEIYNGDSYNLNLKVTVNNKPVDLASVELIEFSIGGITKQWPTEVQYDQGLDTFLFPLSQEESFTLVNPVLYQTRVKYNNSNVYTSPLYRTEVKRSISTNII